MAYRADGFGASLGCDALPGAITRRLPSLNLVNAEESWKPRQAATTGPGTLSAQRG